MKKLLIIGLILFVFGAFYIYITSQDSVEAPVAPDTNNDVTVTSYEECVDAGYTVMERFPPTCVTPSGEEFTQEVEGEVDNEVDIVVDSPVPQTVVSSPLVVEGRARGTWYFEATFPIRLEDENNNIIAEGFATAQDDWMTESFVPFTAELEFDNPEVESGILIVEKANPSGLPENEESIMIPVEFE